MKMQSLKDEAVSLRKAGYSYTYIAQRTSVSKSTLSGWLASVSYKPNKETIDTIGKARTASGLAKSVLKLKSIDKARAEAKKEIGVFNNRDLFMLGIGLYIGEGSKSNNIVRITNSDYRVICLAIRWFSAAIGVPKSNFSIRIHMYPDGVEKDIINYWVKKTGIPLGQFKKSQVDYRIDKKVSRRGNLPYGTAHMTINSCGDKKFGVALFRKIEALSEEVFKNKRV